MTEHPTGNAVVFRLMLYCPCAAEFALTLSRPGRVPPGVTYGTQLELAGVDEERLGRLGIGLDLQVTGLHWVEATDAFSLYLEPVALPCDLDDEALALAVALLRGGGWTVDADSEDWKETWATAPRDHHHDEEESDEDDPDADD